ncbi:MAG: amidohydrolase family protein [Methanomethylovorans sp.]|uniref:amidohydrolase family protein n=1 Tax=Methanomethylovorans sp. TaxID=2758717 RepID=UPI000A81F7C9|nr:amidohydrolase family protein [Methanomethylovorans sp.]
MADMIIKNGHIFTMEPGKEHELKKGVVVIDDGAITEVGERTQESADIIVDARGGIVMPGLVNTHTHAAMTLFRGYADDLPLSQWLQQHIWPAETKLTDNDIYSGTLLACLEMIKSGTTCFNDMYFHMDETAKAVEQTGIRASLSYGMIELGNKDKADTELKEGSRFVQKWQGRADGRITTMYGPHAPNTCSSEFLQRVKDKAREDGVKVHIHILETEAELKEMKEKYGMCSIHMLNNIDFFDTDVVAAHCVWLSDGDIKILAEKGVNISHNPVSNMKLASGIAPITKLLQSGSNVCLGTDGCASNNNLDMFEEMKIAALLQKINIMDPTVLPAKEVLKMATVNGAKALGINAGVIREGALADIIIVDKNKAHMRPFYDAASHLVYSANGQDVMTNIVNGKLLMDNYEVLCMDELKVIEQASMVAENLVQRVNE